MVPTVGRIGSYLLDVSITFFQHESMRWRVCSPGDGEGVVGHDRAARGILWRTSCSCSCIGTVSLMHPARNSTPRSFTAVRYAAGCQRGTRLQPRGCPHHDPALRVECFCACRRATVQCRDAPWPAHGLAWACARAGLRGRAQGARGGRCSQHVSGAFGPHEDD